MANGFARCGWVWAVGFVGCWAGEESIARKSRWWSIVITVAVVFIDEANVDIIRIEMLTLMRGEYFH